MAFAGPTVGEQRATAQLNRNLENIGDMLGELNKTIKHYCEVVEANTKALQEVAEAIGNEEGDVPEYDPNDPDCADYGN